MRINDYQKANINHTPLSQRAGQWESIKDVKSPFLGSAATETAGFGYWFNYLWEEARNVDELSVGDQARLCEAFFAVLMPIDGAGGSSFTPRTGAIDDMARLRVLRTLLVVGFERISLDGAMSSGKVGVKANQAINAEHVFVERMQYTSKSQEQTIHLGFRADSRDYDTLVRQNGLLPRARSAGQDVHRAYGLNKPWNPFSLGVYSNSMFLRKGSNKDNCLHTVVSIGLEFAELLPYPLLSDASLFKLANKPLKTWTAQDEAEALAHRYKVRAVRTKPAGDIDHVESELSIYVLSMDQSRSFSTKAWQGRKGVENPFPEAAVDHVPTESILAEVLLTRKHFFDSDGLSFFDFKVTSIRLLPSPEKLQARFDDAFPTLIEARVQQLERSARGTWAMARARYDKVMSQPTGPGGAAKGKLCDVCGKTFKPILFRTHECVVS